MLPFYMCKPGYPASVTHAMLYHTSSPLMPQNKSKEKPLMRAKQNTGRRGEPVRLQLCRTLGLVGATSTGPPARVAPPAAATSVTPKSTTSAISVASTAATTTSMPVSTISASRPVDFMESVIGVRSGSSSGLRAYVSICNRYVLSLKPMY